MTSSNQPLFRIGSGCRMEWKWRGGCEAKSTNIYIQCVKIKKGIFLLQLVAKEVSACMAEDGMRLVGLQRCQDKDRLCARDQCVCSAELSPVVDRFNCVMSGLLTPPHDCQEAVFYINGHVEYTMNSLFV